MMLNYSVHTYELFAPISLEEFQQIYQTLKLQKGSIEKAEKYHSKSDNVRETTEFIFRQLPFYGINSIRLSKADTSYATIKCLLYLIVNPYNAYMQQFHSDDNIIETTHIAKAIHILHAQAASFLPNAVYDRLAPSRIDFCVNLPFDTQEQAEHYISLLRLGVPFKSLTEYKKYDKIQKRKIAYPHALLLQCKSYSFEIYSKYEQMKHCKLTTSTTDGFGIVRIELRAKRSKLKRLSKKYDRDLVSHDYDFESFSAISKSELLHILSKMIGHGDLHSYSYTKKQIEDSDFRINQKRLMLATLKYFSQRKKGQDILTQTSFKRNDWNRLLEKFDSLGCSPIPISCKSVPEFFPGIDSWDTFF